MKSGDSLSNRGVGISVYLSYPYLTLSPLLQCPPLQAPPLPPPPLGAFSLGYAKYLWNGF